MNIEPIIQILKSYVTTLWTPVFFLLFFAALAYAAWPRNRQMFDTASKIPLRED